MKFLNLSKISSGANNRPKPNAKPQIVSDQLLFITIDENKDPKIIITPKVVVIKLLTILLAGFFSSRDFNFIFFFGNWFFSVSNWE